MSLRKDLKEILDAAERQGWRIEKTGGGHWRLYAPDGRHIIHTGSTPGARSSLDKLVSRMRRHGFVWKGR